MIRNLLTLTLVLLLTYTGIGANLPNMANRMPIGVGTASLNSTGGNSTLTLSQANLPAINLSGGNHTHTITDPGHRHNTWQGSGSQALVNVNGGGPSVSGFDPTILGPFNKPQMRTSTNTTGITLASSGELSIPLGGSATPINVQNPYLATYFFIYLGP